LADIVLVCSLVPFYKNVFEASFVTPFKNVTRWFTTCINQPHFKSVLGQVQLCEKMAVPPTTPVTPAAQPKVEKKAEKKVVEEKEDLEKLAAEEEKPKGKNPLDLLPKSSFILDEWKRCYSNNDTRPTALDWFWANFDSEGYSIWRVEYKYNNELTQVFMSSNLVGGFFQRLERVRKYAFGSMLVLGENNDNEIYGYFVIRGQEVPFEVTDTADYESYQFTKVDVSDGKVKEDVDAVFAWDDKVKGKKCADGKVFK
jgi:elongation factor 1-gamma